MATANEKLAELFKIVRMAESEKPKRTTQAQPKREGSRLTQKAIHKWFGPPLEAAYHKAGLTPEKHAPLLLAIFAFAHFSRGKPGRPKRWTPEKLAHLADHVDVLRAKEPDKSELDYCKRLTARGGPYEKDDARSLRRMLQEGKRFRALQRAVAQA